jgi:hypothetical protein
MLIVQEHPDHPWRVDAQLGLRLRPGNLHLFDIEDGKRLDISDG